MCGVAGFYNIKDDKEVGQCRAIGQAMEQAIAHRGPDAAHIWKSSDEPLVLAHRRLAIIDLSKDGEQPMSSVSGRYVVSYNGEIYNYLELQKDLESAGYIFQSRSDTEVMLTAFEHWGVNQTLQKLNGMFALVLWDKKERQLHFVRDRFGKKPLYIGWAGQDLVFASELKSFHAHPDFVPEINRDALALYMRYGYLHAPYSIFKNVWQLLPAGRMTLDVGNLKVGENLAEQMETYWSLKNIAEEGRAHLTNKSQNEIIDEFEEMLGRAVSMRMMSDVPLGAFLSGGIDSSAIVALMQKQASTPVKTFSIGFDEAGYNEAEHAKKVAEYLGTAHQEFYVGAQDAKDVIPSLPDIYNEPFADSSQIPTYLISKLACDQVSVVLTGDGGDEILGGYDRHTKIPALWSKIGWMPQALRKAGGGVLSLVPEAVYGALNSGNANFGAQVKRSIKLMGLKNADEIYADLVSAWPSGSALVKGGQEPLVPLRDEKFWPQNLGFAESMMFGDSLSYRPNDLMVKTDRASMAVALEARAPLMDYKLAEYSWRLPHHMKVRGRTGKWVLREVLKRHLPQNLYERPKMGFSVPIHAWLRGDLKDWGEDLLSHEALEKQGFLETEMVRKAWRDFQNNQGSQSVPKHLWSVLMFQAWHARWMK